MTNHMTERGIECYISVLSSWKRYSNKHESGTNKVWSVNVFFYGQSAKEIANTEIERFEVEISDGKLYFMPSIKSTNKGNSALILQPSKAMKLSYTIDEEFASELKKFSGTYKKVRLDTGLGTYYVTTSDKTDSQLDSRNAYDVRKKAKKEVKLVGVNTIDDLKAHCKSDTQDEREKYWADAWNERKEELSKTEVPVLKRSVEPVSPATVLTRTPEPAEDYVKGIIRDSLFTALRTNVNNGEKDKAIAIIDILEKEAY